MPIKKLKDPIVWVPIASAAIIAAGTIIAALIN